MGMSLAMSLGVGMEMAVPLIPALIPFQFLTFDAGLPLATATKRTHLFHLKFFDTQFFTAGHANPKAPAGGTGIITLVHGYQLATVRTTTPCRHFQNLQVCPFSQTAAHHCVKTKG